MEYMVRQSRDWCFCVFRSEEALEEKDQRHLDLLMLDRTFGIFDRMKMKVMAT